MVCDYMIMINLMLTSNLCHQLSSIKALANHISDVIKGLAIVDKLLTISISAQKFVLLLHKPNL